MPLPTNFNTKTVVGKYVDLTGAHVQGTIKFVATSYLYSLAEDTTIVPAPIVVALTAGEFSVAIPITDDPDITGSPFVYTVTEEFVGLTGRVYLIELPGSSPNPTQLQDLAPASPPTPGQAYLTQAQGDARYVRTVNSVGPDGSGNVVVTGGGSGDVPSTRLISAGTGLTGGGSLAADRTISADFGTSGTTVAAGNHNHNAVYYTETEVDSLLSANSTDDRARGNHSGTQASGTISDFVEAVQDVVAGLLGAGSNITLTYDDGANTLTVASSGGGSTDPEVVRDTIGIALLGSGLITVTVNDALDTITISTTATANDTNANLRDRATHTGTQDAVTIGDSTTVGRNVLTATDGAAARTAIGAGTSNLAIGTTGTTAKAGNWTPTIADQPPGYMFKIVQVTDNVIPARGSSRTDIYAEFMCWDDPGTTALTNDVWHVVPQP